MADGAGDTTEDGDEVGVGVGVALTVGPVFCDGRGELIVGLGLVGVTVGAEVVVGVTVAGAVPDPDEEEELVSFGVGGLTQK